MAAGKVSFYKMTGGGNDFVLFDNRQGTLPEDYASLASQVCRRKFSIGADGILVLEKCSEADFRMVYYNSDGSRASLCGNGARCIARFAHILKAAPARMTFMTDAGLLSAEVGKETVKLKMGQPTDLRLDFPVKLDDKEFNLSSINTGVPHAVLMVADAEKVDVEGLGKSIRYHKEFSPDGTNVDFVMQKDDHTLLVRTYERGVEGETLACGTGVVASSLISAAQGMTESPVSCLTKGGETMKVHFHMEKENGKSPKIAFQDVHLEGSAVVCFVGEVEI
jgi:diaminopimelate epimerase